MTLRLFSLGLELSAFLIWLNLMRLARWGIEDPEDRAPFRAAAFVVLATAVTTLASTLTAIEINAPVLITTWTPAIVMFIAIGIGALLSVPFKAKQISACTKVPTWHPESINKGVHR